MEPRRYGMSEGTAVAAQAASALETWLRGLPKTVDVKNVEDDPAYRQRDVDLLWTTQQRVYQIEVKGDRWANTGNFFFETVSNEERGTPGCFLYTEADFIFYYFVFTKVLYILPMPATRDWFVANMDRFRERRTTTPAGQAFYTTVGRLVPIRTILRAVPNVRTEHL